MEKQIIISGFGGQGVVFAGKLLAEAAMRDSLLSTYFPSYGVAMRGGAAKCDVTVSDREIGSPVIDAADAVISMSIQAKRKYEKSVKPGGMLILNSSLVAGETNEEHIEYVEIPATDTANEIGSSMVATLICLGCAASSLGVPSLESFYSSLEAKVGKFGEKMLEYNKIAMKKGWEYKKN